MGKLLNGLFGGFHGRVGNLVGYTLKGKYVIRMIGKSTKPLTPARKANCQKMTVVNEILKPSLQAIRVGFRLAVAGTDRNEYNEAVSYNKKNALQGVYPNISLDYSKVLMSMGTLPVAVKPSISQAEEKITFNWEISASPVSEYHTDRTMLVIYFPDIKETFYQLSGAKRVEGKDVVVISSEHINERMEAYISFVKDDGKAVSNSVHVGSLNLNNSAKTTSNNTLKSKESPLEFLVEQQENPLSAPGEWSQYVVKNRSNDEILADYAIKLNQDTAQISESGIFNSPIQNQSEYAKETFTAMLSFLFEKMKVSKITKNVNATDQDAIHLLTSLRFRQEAYFMKNTFLNDKWIDECRFAILTSEWDLIKHN
ncbi:GNAT family N-acetyltransferase [Pedobacter caeni]|uniref:Protein N-acetyltransferase, RimJ/RimL family n=1 Tax=Pedobacter caeni TaxID=288992 RepID=A0A1M4UIA6_9SPHI|nr:GNAT family N-acetyltransferase [Pedobacter caeni]SHE56405.1 Protein N-acetyltransferase, RimJ/RimL family [Pedobacter caeni]